MRERRGEACTHACHFPKTHDNAAKMKCQVHYTQGSLGIDAQLREIKDAGVACVRVRGCALGGTCSREGVRLVFTHATSTKRMKTRLKCNPRFNRPKGVRE